jgi:hypothetical protein
MVTRGEMGVNKTTHHCQDSIEMSPLLTDVDTGAIVAITLQDADDGDTTTSSRPRSPQLSRSKTRKTT